MIPMIVACTVPGEGKRREKVAKVTMPGKCFSCRREREGHVAETR